MNIQLSWHFPFSIVLPWNLCQKSIDHNCEGLNLSLLYLVFFPLYQVFWFSKTQRMAECPTIIHVLFSHVIQTSFRIAILILPTLWFSVHFLKWCTEKLTGSSGQEWSLSIVSFPLVWCGWTVSLKNPSNVVSMDPPRVSDSLWRASPISSWWKFWKPRKERDCTLNEVPCSLPFPYCMSSLNEPWVPESYPYPEWITTSSWNKWPFLSCRRSRIISLPLNRVEPEM